MTIDEITNSLPQQMRFIKTTEENGEKLLKGETLLDNDGNIITMGLNDVVVIPDNTDEEIEKSKVKIYNIVVESLDEASGTTNGYIMFNAFLIWDSKGETDLPPYLTDIMSKHNSINTALPCSGYYGDNRVFACWVNQNNTNLVIAVATPDLGGYLPVEITSYNATVTKDF